MMMRSPITTPAESKTVTLFQLDRNSEAFGHNFYRNIVGDFVPMSEMVPIVTEKVDASMGDTSILDSLFAKYNGGDIDALQYSMSVGDIIQIDDVAYRCQMFGWARV